MFNSMLRVLVTAAATCFCLTQGLTCPEGESACDDQSQCYLDANACGRTAQCPDLSDKLKPGCLTNAGSFATITSPLTIAAGSSDVKELITCNPTHVPTSYNPYVSCICVDVTDKGECSGCDDVNLQRMQSTLYAATFSSKARYTIECYANLAMTVDGMPQPGKMDTVSLTVEVLIASASGSGSVEGDPHHKTFDGAMIDFQGVDTYILTRHTGSKLTKIEVSARYEEYTRNVSKIASLIIDFMSDRIVLLPKKKVRVNCRQVTLPFRRPAYSVQREGDWVVFRDTTKQLATGGESIVAAYNGRWKSRIELPHAYRGHVQGLLGNFDGLAANDFVTSDGTYVNNDVDGQLQIGESWASPDKNRCV